MPRATIQYLAGDGVGVARDGKTRIRIPGTLPGETVDYTVIESRRRQVSGGLDAVIDPSSSRIEPACADQSRCGGCDLGFFGSEARAAHLIAAATRLFGREPAWVPSPRSRGHRARIKLAVEDGRTGYRAPASHDLVVFETCGIARPEIQSALATLRSAIGGSGEVELRSDGSRVVVAATGDLTGLKAFPDVAVDGRRSHGDPTLVLQVGDVALRASPRSFYQVNLEANLHLVNTVRDRVAEVGPERILDLYAGIGNLTLPLAHEAPVVAVELEGQATADLRHNATQNGLAAQVSVLGLAAERFDPSREPYDVAVLDPPRAGSGKVLARVLRNRPRRVVLVCCHPPSGVRDLKIATDAGYTLTHLSCFDFFPDTHHYESVLILDR